jgi:tetratricopeptide (TPR) repeat protein
MLHRQAKDFFLAALDLPADQRAAYVARVSAHDPELRQEIDSLLAFHEEEQGEAAADGEEEDAPKGRFAPGDLFAGRSRMIAAIGHGGMGDVWRADDLVLETAVALKLIDATGADARARILNEVRLARRITHPAICRVFDVGESDGVVFYSMELVRGEDLASLLRRVGRLPSEKVVDIARQLCAGLAAAHGQGVLHRDLKPANVLIDDDGLVRITDFGIALPTRDAGMHRLTGTPGYMAPEQRAEGTLLTERTDVYALGVVLYELLVGQHPFPAPAGGGEPPRPSTLVANVNARLERVIMSAISLDPARRPASALEIAANLPDKVTQRGGVVFGAAARPRLFSGRSWTTAAAIAAVAGVLAMAASYFVVNRGRGLTAQDTVVLADFDNTTGEPVFDGALKVALAVALEQSPFLKVFPDDRARETLALMQRPAETRVTRAVARDIARREQFKALIAGSIASLGNNYVIALEAVNVDTGDVMAREQAEAGGKEQVLTQLGAASARLREKLGESLASVETFDVALPRATTSSLDALHTYSLALSNGVEVPRLEAIPHLERAIELDPTFAMAHAFLSNVYTNTGQTSVAPTYARRAFELRDRVSERERFSISWRYYRDAIQNWDKALELARSWTATYPREAAAFNSLGIAYLRVGEFDRAVDPLREAIRLDSRLTPAYSNLAGALLSLNRFTEARTVLQQATERHLDFNGMRRLSYLLAFVQGDSATMARELERSVGPRETNSAFGWQAHTSVFGGHVSAAHDQFARGIQRSLQGDFREVAAQLTMEDAESHATVGQCTTAREEVARGLPFSRDYGTLERASRALALCGADAESAALSAELARRFPEATLANRVAIPVSAAAIALDRGQADRVLQLLEAVKTYDHAPSAEFWPPYLRGQARLRLKDAAGAAAEFQMIIDHRGEVPASALYALAHVGLARAAVLTGDANTARKAYESFFALWRDADPDLAPLKEARLEYARLAGAG